MTDTKIATTLSPSKITGTALVQSAATTKGDLLAATAASAFARFGVGSDGQVLTADSTQTAGLKWSTSSGITQSQADARYLIASNYKVVNLRTAGAVGDGTTDDATVIQTAVNNASAGTTLYLPAGTYLLRSGIKWKSGISLLGDGVGKTILKPNNSGPFASGFSAIYNFTDGSTSSTFDDCTFADFEIDGSGVTTSSYDVGSKGINILYMKRARFLNLYIHNTWATGIGCDQLVDSAIINCVCNSCGVGNNGTQPGGAGIGIGTCQFASMPLVIMGCVAKSNATHGIFFEHQNSGITTRSYGVRISDCHVEGNNYGISDWGADGLTVTGCTFNNNTTYGFGSIGNGVAHFIGTNGILSNCTFTGHPNDAIKLGDAMTRYVVRGNLIKLGSGNGITIGNVFDSAATANTEVTISDNEIVANNAAGIRINAPLSYSAITNNRIRNNGRTTTNATDLRSGISINAAMDHAIITGNTCWDDQGTPTQTYGLYITGSGSITNGTMRNNTPDGNLTGASSFTTIGLASTAIRDTQSTTITPSATANTPGTAVLITPAAGKMWFTTITNVVSTFASLATETVQANYIATYNDGTTSSTQTLSIAANGNKIMDSIGLKGLNKDGLYITKLSVTLQSTIASSTATGTAIVVALQD